VFLRDLGMTNELNNKATPNYYRMSDALATVYEIAQEGKLGKPADVKQLYNYLHSTMATFKHRNEAVLEGHTPEIVDVNTIARNIISERDKKDKDDKWNKVVVIPFVKIRLINQNMFQDIPGAAERIQNAKGRNFNLSLVSMTYQVIAYFRSPAFVNHIHARLGYLGWHGDQSLFDIIQKEMIDEVSHLPRACFMDEFDEKQTFKALVSFMHQEKTMTCLRRVFMAKAFKYLQDPDGKMVKDDIAQV
jgi:hypothetical protein